VRNVSDIVAIGAVVHLSISQFGIGFDRLPAGSQMISLASSGPHGPAIAAVAGRRGNKMSVATTAVGTKRPSRRTSRMSASDPKRKSSEASGSAFPGRNLCPCDVSRCALSSLPII
jgi:hypothetical protein